VPVFLTRQAACFMRPAPTDGGCDTGLREPCPLPGLKWYFDFDGEYAKGFFITD
jgi:hypothetical protein